MAITRLKLTYRSKEKCDTKPAIFTTGGYSVRLPDGRIYNFDFEDMESLVRFENGYMFIDVLQKNQDLSLCPNGEFDDEPAMTEKEYVEMLTTVATKCRKEDFTEIFYESWTTEDEENGDSTPLICLDMTFYDYSTSGTGESMELQGEAFADSAYPQYER